ncbi:MAG TPA: hypothetical protein VG410_08955 [Solirubrobacteraceae bacterium]|nr:hypothetical protein [Solirubrobacteraceae bacterium]
MLTLLAAALEVGVVVVVVLGVVVVWVRLVEPLLLVVVAAAAVVAALVVARLRDSAGSFPLISVIAIASHAATNKATAPATTRERISRARCALVMSSSLDGPRRNSVWVR